MVFQELQCDIFLFSVTHYIAPGQSARHSGRPHLRNLLHAWRKLQKYQKLKKGRLNTTHDLKHKTKQEVKHKVKHKLKHEFKLSPDEQKDKTLASKHAKHHHQHHHHRHHHHHHRAIVSKNGTGHNKTTYKMHKVQNKEKTILFPNSTEYIKKGIEYLYYILLYQHKLK